MSSLVRNLRYTLRTLRRDAGFTAFAILIAGLGIGASATVFSVVNTLLLRPLPVRAARRSLVWIANQRPPASPGRRRRSGTCSICASEPRRSRELAGYFAFYGVGDNMLTGHGEPERLNAVPVSDNFFQVLGVQPQLGRTFTAEECTWNGPEGRAAEPRAVGAPLRLGPGHRRTARSPSTTSRYDGGRRAAGVVRFRVGVRARQPLRSLLAVPAQRPRPTAGATRWR